MKVGDYIVEKHGIGGPIMRIVAIVGDSAHVVSPYALLHIDGMTPRDPDEVIRDWPLKHMRALSPDDPHIGPPFYDNRER